MFKKLDNIGLMMIVGWASTASGSIGQACRQLIAEDSQHNEIGVVLDWGQGIGLNQANVALDADGLPLVIGVQPDGFNFGPYLITPVFFANGNCTGQAFVASQQGYQPPSGVAGGAEDLYIGDATTAALYSVASSKNADDDSCQPAGPAVLMKAHRVVRLGSFVRPFRLVFRKCDAKGHND
jgi:hypothetical protein